MGLWNVICCPLPDALLSQSCAGNRRGGQHQLPVPPWESRSHWEEGQRDSLGGVYAGCLLRLSLKLEIAGTWRGWEERRETVMGIYSQAPLENQ
jgi:hypothetical protein